MLELKKYCLKMGIKLIVTPFELKAILPDGVVFRRSSGAGEFLKDIVSYMNGLGI